MHPRYDACLCSASEWPSDEHLAGWPSAGTGFKAEYVKESTSEVGCFDAFLAEKALGKDGSCHQGHITLRKSDL